MATLATINKFFSVVLLVVCVVLILVVLIAIPSLPDDVRFSNTVCIPEPSCGRSRDIISNYFNQVLNKKYNELRQNETEKAKSSVDAIFLKQLMKNDTQSMKPAARYTGRPLTDAELKGSSSTPVVEADIFKHVPAWDLRKGVRGSLGFQRYGMKLRNGWLTVPLSGTYHVYSGVEFYEDFDRDGPPDGFDAIPVLHAIFRYNVMDEVEHKIVTSEQPHIHPHRRAFNVYSSYVSAIVELKAGDELSIKVSNLTHLRDTQFNYFGVGLV